MSKQVMRTPVSYYGGKQKLVSKILPMIPKHNLYVEPFCGGAAVFFSKEPSEIEVLNDTNRELINLYSVIKNHFIELEKRISVTLHSRKQHRQAQVIYENPELFDEVQRAWAVWVLSSQSFSAMLDGSFGYDKGKNTTTKKIMNKKAEFTEQYAIRLQNVQVECADALYIIESRDTPETFVYADPPYFNSDCGHYDGYSEQDFENLLKKLASLQGKFLLSCYPSKLLDQYIKTQGWKWQCYEQGVSVNAKGGYLKRKWEMLITNYPI